MSIRPYQCARVAVDVFKDLALSKSLAELCRLLVAVEDEHFDLFARSLQPSRASIEGRTTDSWIEYSTSFTAPEQKLSVILRKNSPGVGTMLFDSISLSEIGAAVQRFRNQPQMFSEVITTRAYAVFEVTSK